MNNLRTYDALSNAQLEEIGVDTIARRIGQAIQSCGEADSLDENERSLLTHAVEIVKRLETLPDAETIDAVVVVKSMALGKLGRFSEAADDAQSAYERHPSWSTAIAVANLCRRAGDIRRAIEMWSAAAEHDPKDVTALLEIGDSYLELSEWVPAIEHYEWATAREPRQAWAVPSIDFCQYALTGDKTWLQRLKRRANKKHDECGVENMLAQLTGVYSSDVGTQRAQQLLERLPLDTK